jgi:hypothetical protein
MRRERGLDGVSGGQAQRAAGTHPRVGLLQLREGVADLTLHEHAANEAEALPISIEDLQRIHHCAMLIGLNTELCELLRKCLALPLQHPKLLPLRAIDL